MPRLIWVLTWLTLFMIPIALIAPLPPHRKRRASIIIYRALARIFRIRVSVRGKISHKEPILFASNHMSYVDIMVLGASLPGNFISKAEVKKWPVFGWIAALNGTVFISRRKSGAASQASDVEAAVDHGKNLIIFPEGTTSDGKAVMAFKSSLFRIVESRAVTVQPVTINYTHINGLPIQANERVKIAWIGDSDLIPHLREFVNLGFIRAEVKIHAPLSITGSRKLVADEAHRVVAASKE